MCRGIKLLQHKYRLNQNKTIVLINESILTLNYKLMTLYSKNYSTNIIVTILDTRSLKNYDYLLEKTQNLQLQYTRLPLRSAFDQNDKRLKYQKAPKAHELQQDQSCKLGPTFLKNIL